MELNEKLISLYDSGKGISQHELAKRFFMTPYQVRKVVDPVAYEATLISRRQRRRGQQTSVRTYRHAGSRDHDTPLYDPRKQERVYHSSLTAELMGDPLPGRSALEQRQRQTS